MITIYNWGTPLYAQSVDLRNEVLRKPLNMVFYPNELIKEINCFHIAFIDCYYTMIACLYLKKVDRNTLQLKQMAVKPGFQYKGYGSILVRESERIALLYDYSTIILHARHTATGFYETLGYMVTSDQFMEIGLKHYKMEKNIKKTY